MYFPMRTVIARIGGIAQTAEELGVSKNMVAAWVAPTQRSRPPQDLLERMCRMSGVALDCVELYFKKLEVYREHESFRRRPKQ